MKTIALPLTLRLLQGIDFQRKLGLCERLFALNISKHGICWANTAAGVPWKLDLRNATHRWIVYGKYEGASFLNWAKRFPPDDVEGYEIPALKGAESWLTNHRIRAIYVELDGDNGRAIMRYLAARDYTFHSFDRGGKLRRCEKMPTEHTYGLFLPQGESL